MKGKGWIIAVIIGIIILIVVIYLVTRVKKVKKKVKDAKGNIVEVVVEEKGLPSWCDPANPGKNYFGWESDACVKYYADLCDPDKPGWNKDGFMDVNCG